MNIQRLNTSHVPDLVSLHETTLQGLSTALGSSYLRTYYQTLCSDVKNIGIFGIVENGKIVGTIAVTSSPQKSMHTLSPTLSIQLIWSVIKALAKNQITLQQIVGRVRFTSLLKTTIPAHANYILVLMVDTKYRKRHVATELLHHIHPKFPGDLWVDTKKQNIPAYSFYKNNGFSLEKSCCDSVLLKK
jgi:ribosomal protein S18 acetylase RimI-like enzyme